MSGTIRNCLVVFSTGFGGYYYYKYQKLYKQVYGEKQDFKIHKEVEIHQEMINEEPIIVIEPKIEVKENIQDEKLPNEKSLTVENTSKLESLPVIEKREENVKSTQELPSATQRARGLIFDENNRIKRRLFI